MLTRREFLKLGIAASASVLVPWRDGTLRAFPAAYVRRAYAQWVAQQTLNHGSIPRYTAPMVIPPAMPMSGVIRQQGGKKIAYYEIAVREFAQQILPTGYAATTVWSYGSVDHPGTVGEGGTFNYPAFTIEAKYNKPLRVKWINDLGGKQHLLPVDQTLHWANPLGTPDSHGTSHDPYTGPVPIVTHVHGAHTTQESDGYPEAWYLPDGSHVGSRYDQFKGEFEAAWGVPWDPGTATFQYPNTQRATTLWYHDHTLGMTRVNVYAGPAGFYLIRGGPDDRVTLLDGVTPAILPGRAPKEGDKGNVSYYEIPIVIQDRSFTDSGQLFYPDNRAFFEGLDPAQLQIPFWGESACGGDSDVPPIWQPEFFGEAMVVNGVSWPFLEVEPRRYRFRLLNGCNSRFLILRFDPTLPVYQIGADGGFLAAPVNLTGGQLLMGPAERADVIVDFTGLTPGTQIKLLNDGPDAPFGGDPVDPDDLSMPQMREVMQFRVVPLLAPDDSTPPDQLMLPVIPPIDAAAPMRPLSLNEEESKTVFVTEVTAENQADWPENSIGDIVLDCTSDTPFGPTAALLGTMQDADPATPDGVVDTPVPMLWSDDITENPALGATETWEIYNFTADAHPIHIHLVQFQVVDRQALNNLDADGIAVPPAVPDPTSPPRPPEPGETGFKDTVIAYPGEVTRVQAHFDIAGLYVWHCHIVEHEDNEMMRPYQVGP